MCLANAYSCETYYPQTSMEKNRVKAGTQIVDRAWKFIKKRLRLNQFTKVGSSLLRAHIRSAQYEYWHRNRDLCACAGQLLLSI